MSKLKWLLIPMMSLMLGCHVITVPVETSCLWVKPIETNDADRKVIPRAVKLQIAAHNDLYDSRCGEQ